MDWNEVEKQFQKLDQKEYGEFSRDLGALYRSFKSEGFSNREAFKLVEMYAKTIYDMVFDEYIRSKEKEDDEWVDEEDDSVDSEEDE